MPSLGLYPAVAVSESLQRTKPRANLKPGGSNMPNLIHAPQAIRGREDYDPAG